MGKSANIKRDVTRFMNENKFRTIIINGEWGIGKTYSTLDTLKNECKIKEKKIKIISLISLNFNDVLKELLSEDYNVLVELTQLRTITGLSFNGSASILGTGGGAGYSKTMNSNKQVFNDRKSKFKPKNLSAKKVIIFDDIEHYNGDIKDLIRLVEGVKKSNNGIKIIIIGNFEAYKNYDAEKNVKQEISRISEKLEATQIEVENRQGEDIFSKDFKDKINSIEFSNKFLKLNNMRILKYLFNKYKNLNLELKKIQDINIILLKIYIDKMSDIDKREEWIKLLKPTEKRVHFTSQRINSFEANYLNKNYDDEISQIFWFSARINKVAEYFNTNMFFDELENNLSSEEFKNDYLEELSMSLFTPNSKINKIESKKIFKVALKRLEKSIVHDNSLMRSNPIIFINFLLELCFLFDIDVNEHKKEINLFYNDVLDLRSKQEQNITELDYIDYLIESIELSDITNKIPKFKEEEFIQKYQDTYSDLIRNILHDIKKEKIKNVSKDDLENKIIKVFARGSWSNISINSIYNLKDINPNCNKDFIYKIQNAIFSFVTNQKDVHWTFDHMVNFFEIFWSKIYQKDKQWADEQSRVFFNKKIKIIRNKKSLFYKNLNLIVEYLNKNHF